MNSLRIPINTYRFQFNRQFRFKDARPLVPYLHRLGISEIYASPVLKARRGSSHGYDVTDPSRLNPEIGTAGEFDASVVPEGRYLLRIYPKVYFTNAYFSDGGRALNSETITSLLYCELPVHLQYGLTGSLSIGAIIPLGWTYQELRPDLNSASASSLTVRELWLTVQHKWWAFWFISSSSVRVKIPLAKKSSWEDG